MANPVKIKAYIKEIVAFGRNVYKIILLCENRFPRYKAGQFLHLTLDQFDPSLGFWPESRVFSIADVSEDRKEVTIVYSVKGVYTQRMEQVLAPGNHVWVKAPYGEFIIPNFLENDDTVVLVAGGTGIAPFIPFIKQSSMDTPTVLFYGLRTPELLIFPEFLQEYLTGKNHRLHLFVENPGCVDFNGKNFWVHEGMLSVPKILEHLNNAEMAKFFLSGPPAMIKSFQEGLYTSGIQPSRIIIDEWS